MAIDPTHHRFAEPLITRKAKGKMRGSEYTLRIENTQCGRDYTFVLKGSHLEVLPEPHGHVNTDDWYVSLTEVEKADLMRRVLAFYRETSLEPGGMKTAAVGIVKNPDLAQPASQRHLIYVGVNTTRLASEMYKDCAEQNMVNAATASVARHMGRHYSQRRYSEPAKIEEIHVMGGRSRDVSNPHDRGVNAICACGKCTDMLAKVMTEKGKVYVYPAMDKKKVLGPVSINSVADKLSDLGLHEIWQTTIGHLNRHRVIPLEDEIAAIQEAGLRDMARRLVNYTPPEVSDEVLARMVENKKLHRRSIAELDVITKDGKPDLKGLKKYFRDELLEILDDRATRDHVVRDENALFNWMKEKVNNVACVVMQADNGGYFVGYDSQTGSDHGSDNAFAIPEFTALGNAVPVLGTQGIRKMWHAEVNPPLVLLNQLRTAAKDGIERAGKRKSKTGDKKLEVCSLLLDDGTLSPEKEQEIADYLTFDFSDVFPGQFAGVAKNHDQPNPVNFATYINDGRSSWQVKHVNSQSGGAAKSP